jgi:hypothetical protein
MVGIYYDALRDYVPQPYPGHIIYISSEQRSERYSSQWARIAESFDLGEVPDCDHMSFFHPRDIVICPMLPTRQGLLASLLHRCRKHAA